MYFVSRTNFTHSYTESFGLVIAGGLSIGEWVHILLISLSPPPPRLRGAYCDGLPGVAVPGQKTARALRSHHHGHFSLRVLLDHCRLNVGTDVRDHAVLHPLWCNHVQHYYPGLGVCQLLPTVTTALVRPLGIEGKLQLLRWEAAGRAQGGPTGGEVCVVYGIFFLKTQSNNVLSPIYNCTETSNIS